MSNRRRVYGNDTGIEVNYLMFSGSKAYGSSDGENWELLYTHNFSYLGSREHDSHPSMELTNSIYWIKSSNLLRIDKNTSEITTLDFHTACNAVDGNGNSSWRWYPIHIFEVNEDEYVLAFLYNYGMKLFKLNYPSIESCSLSDSWLGTSVYIDSNNMMYKLSHDKYSTGNISIYDLPNLLKSDSSLTATDTISYSVSSVAYGDTLWARHDTLGNDFVKSRIYYVYNNEFYFITYPSSYSNSTYEFNVLKVNLTSGTLSKVYSAYTNSTYGSYSPFSFFNVNSTVYLCYQQKLASGNDWRTFIADLNTDYLGSDYIAMDGSNSVTLVNSWYYMHPKIHKFGSYYVLEGLGNKVSYKGSNLSTFTSFSGSINSLDTLKLSNTIYVNPQ